MKNTETFTQVIKDLSILHQIDLSNKSFNYVKNLVTKTEFARLQRAMNPNSMATLRFYNKEVY